MTLLLRALNGVVWSPPLLALLLAAGLWFSLRSRFLQVRLLGPMLRLLTKGRAGDGISPFQAFCTALAGRVGTGNIVGTSAAVLYGGPGALFWMWVLAFLGAASAFVESTLAQLYREPWEGQYCGGPAFYIEKGLRRRGCAAVFAVVALTASGLLLPGVQSNAIAQSLQAAFRLPVWLSGGVCTLLLGVLIFGGIRRIARAAEFIVPAMAALYLLCAGAVTIAHLREVGPAFALILSSAFGRDALYGGIFGSAILWGVRRGIYANEAGQGTQAHAAAAAAADHPAEQGLVQALGVYVDTFLICTATGLMLLLTDCYNVLDGAGQVLHRGAPMIADCLEPGPRFVQAALASVLGPAGPALIALCLAFFAFTSLMSCYYQAECNLLWLLRSERRRAVGTPALRCALLIVTFTAALMTADSVWSLGDLGAGTMAWLNGAAILLLQKPAFDSLRDYERRRKQAPRPLEPRPVLRR